MNLFELLKTIFELFMGRHSATPAPVSPPIFDEDVYKETPTIEVEPTVPVTPSAPEPISEPVLLPQPVAAGPWKFQYVKNQFYTVIDNVIIGNLKNGNPALSPNFNANEFACPCCKEYRIAIPVLEGLQAARVLIDKPLYVAKTTLGSSINPAGSGYRCPKHNSRVKGASPTSLHMEGRAIDISCPSISVDRLVQYLEQIPVFRNGGIGVYATFVHVDNGRKRRWTA